MPVQYGSILEEHRAVRERVGLFDLSHMGELFVEGPEAGAALAAALVTDPPALAVGRAHYSMICAADGGIIDDLIVYRLADDRFLVVANAGNARGRRRTPSPSGSTGFRAVLDDRSLATGLRRGPGSALAPDVLAPADRRRPRRARATTPSPRARSPASRRWSPGPATPARTASRSSSTRPGPASCGTPCWPRCAAAGGVPVGLGARDTLRLEAGMPLYGNELDLDDRPVRGRPGPGGQARQGRRLRRPRGAREGRRATVRRDASSA